MILYLSFSEPLDPNLVATGNQVRCAGITHALKEQGYDVTHYSFNSNDDEQQLSELLNNNTFSAILVAYWSLLSSLPETDTPVILDVIAPRLLEADYDGDGALIKESREMLQLLPKADQFIVGNQRQADFLLPLLMLSGINCRQKAPILQIPISAWLAPEHQSKTPETPIKLVSAGVDWPWRQSQEYINTINGFCNNNSQCVLQNISGAYPGAEHQDESSKLVSYQRMQDIFLQKHVGIELGEQNTEREFSHSFRIIEYMQCGLPVIVNHWLPIADLIRKYDAGWVITQADELKDILQSITREPSLLINKSENATRLLSDHFRYTESIKPLLAFLENPVITNKTTPLISADKPGYVQRLRSHFLRKLRSVFSSGRKQQLPDILMVSRDDLFPVDHGAAVKIIRTAESLSRLGQDVYLTTENRKQYYVFHDGEMTTRKLPLWLRVLAIPRRVALVLLLLKGYPRSNAFLNAPMSDWSYIFRTIYLTRKFPIGAYHAEFPAYVRPCIWARGIFGGKILLVEHNVEYMRLKEQIKNISPRQFHILKNMELKMCHMSDAIITVSDNDKSILIDDGVNKNKIKTVPHGVDLHTFENAAVKDLRNELGIPKSHSLLVYHGTYSYAPNLEAITVMAEEILPRLSHKGYKASVIAIGSKPPTDNIHPDIHFLGSVDNLSNYLPAADFAVVPLQEGGGTRMKILDYFAAKTPVISTHKGIEGIPVENGVHAIIVDDFDQITEAIIHLMNNPIQAENLAKNGHLFVSNLSWDAIAEKYLALYK